MPTLKAGLLATALASVAVLPAAAILTLASVETAHAKGGNGNDNSGNGNGGGNGGRGSEARGAGSEAKAGGRPESAGSRGNGGNAARGSGRGESDPISNFIRGLSGQEKRDAREAERAAARAARLAPSASAPESSIAPPKRPARSSDMHPGDLGNMNAALNADMNAVLAHIRNGNTNGPVGQMAALAVASVASADEDAGLLAAQESILAYWNKNPDSDPAISEELERPLLEALMSRFDGHEADIEQAMADAEARSADEDLEATCEDSEECDTPETEAVVATAD